MSLFDSLVPAISRPELPSPIIDCLRRGGLVVTGNRRAARALRLAHAAHQRRNGLKAWLTPSIFDWDAGMSSLWRECLLRDAKAPLLLSPLQERAVWKRIARKQGEGQQVVSQDNLATLAQRAYGLLGAYNLHRETDRSWEYAGLGDAEAFRRWSQDFDRDCKQNGWLSRSRIESLLVKAVNQRSLQLPAEILLAGFDRILPNQESLLETLRRSGVPVARFDEEAGNSLPPLFVEARDWRDEIRSCAWWIRGKLEADPRTRIAIIVQDPAAMRGEIARTFRSVLMPQSTRIDAPPAALPFEFSLGSPLETAPAPHAALLWLRWLREPLPLEQISWLMLSGFLSDADSGRNLQLERMAQLDAELRRKGRLQPEVALEAWLWAVGRANTDGASRLRDRVKAASEAGVSKGIDRRTRTFSDWVEIAQGTLNRLGWSRPGKPDSVEYQARQGWDRLLDEVSALGFDGSRVEYSEFVAVVDHYAAEVIFSPESHHAPVQIMGPLESAGQRFDAVWFLGADDTRWPASGRPNPLLPRALQRAARMPHASAAIDSELALAVTRRLLASAGECVFSYAMQNEQGPVRPSPLLAEAGVNLREPETSEVVMARYGAVIIRRHSVALEEPDPSIIPWPQDLPAGGASILKKQAACPFQSFAERRLGAEQLEQPEMGLGPREQGNLVHAILEAVFSENTPPEWRLNTRDDIVTAIATFRLDSILSHHIDNALQSRAAHADRWMQAYLRSEQSRVLSLLKQWFDREAARQPFRVVATEKKLPDVAVGPLKLRLRADRVDELPDGGRLLLDYKTGEVRVSQWNGDRPDDPQLPLYAAYGGEENLRGILFAQIRAGSVDIQGRIEDALTTLDASLGKQDRLLKDPYHPAMKEQWAIVLRDLAEEFLRGEAAVAPKQYPATCELCALGSLCRVRETRVPLNAPDVDDEKVEKDQPGNGEASGTAAESQDD